MKPPQNQRRIPKARDLRPLLVFKKPVLSPRERRLARAVTIADLRGIAKRRTPKAAFDYTCLLYTSPSPRDGLLSRMPSSA